MREFKFLLFSFFIAGLVEAQAQQDSCKTCKPFPWEIGVPVGINQYFGDMHCSKPYASQNSLMGGLFVRRYFGNNFALRPQILVGRLAGRDIDAPDGRWDYRRLSFKSTPFIEAALLGEWYPLGDRKFTCDGFTAKTIAPYLFGGLGVNYGNPKVYTDASASFPVRASDLLDDRENLKKWSAVFPVGVGAKWNLAQRWSLGAEAGYRFSTSDYLDGISMAGNADRKDGYFLANLLASYRFGDKDSDKDGTVDKCDVCPNEVGLAKFQGCPDTDGDGTPDNYDACPTVPGSHVLKGCPDTDDDGVADQEDECPTIYGSIDLKGCPDSDFDGIADKDDACPEISGVKELNGCPDTDGDGISDKDDACPTMAGSASLNGCPDSDGDGIADSKDDCIDLKGSSASNGCPDADGDGVPDNKDKCPTVAGLASNAGCPKGYTSNGGNNFQSASGCVIPADELEQLNFAAQSIEFYPGTNKIKPSSYKALQRVCNILARCKDSKLQINTYNDGTKTVKNLKLASLRSCAIFSYFLKKKCIAKSRMVYKGFYDEDTNVEYTTADGNKSGSRTEFILK